MNWNSFKNLPKYRNVPVNEVNRQYNSKYYQFIPINHSGGSKSFPPQGDNSQQTDGYVDDSYFDNEY